MSSLLLAIGALSLTVTKIVDLIRNLMGAREPSIPKWVWNVVALVVGLVFALGWQINLAADMAKLVPALADKTSALQGTAGQILTGLVVGASAGFWHEGLDALSSIANRNNAQVPESFSE